MKEKRRQLPRAVPPPEMLDDRIVPSAMGAAPMGHPALAEHALIHGRMQHHLRVQHPLRIRGHLPLHRWHMQQAGALSTANQAVPGGPLSLARSSANVNVAVAPIGPTMAGVATDVMRSGSVATAAVIPNPTSSTTSDAGAATSATVTPTVTEIKNGPMAKAGQDLITIYQEYQQQGASSTFTSSKAGYIEIQGTNVGVDVHSSGGSFDAFVAKLNGLGMKIRSQDATSGTVEGLLPIAQLLTVAQDSQTLSLNPVSVAQTSSFSMNSMALG